MIHGGRYVQYNVYGNLFELPSKFVPPLRPIGRGAYGIVWYLYPTNPFPFFFYFTSINGTLLAILFFVFSAAVNCDTHEEVAIKKIGNAFDNIIDAKRTLREIKLLRHMDHENVFSLLSFQTKNLFLFIFLFLCLLIIVLSQIIAVRDIIRPPRKDTFNDVYIVYELMDTDLHHIIRSDQPLNDDHCQVSLYSDRCLLFFLLHCIHIFYKKNHKESTFVLLLTYFEVIKSTHVA